MPVKPPIKTARWPIVNGFRSWMVNHIGFRVAWLKPNLGDSWIAKMDHTFSFMPIHPCYWVYGEAKATLILQWTNNISFHHFCNLMTFLCLLVVVCMYMLMLLHWCTFCGCSAGGMALSTLVTPTVNSLSNLSKSSNSNLQLWSLHALLLTIEAAGLSYISQVQVLYP